MALGSANGFSEIAGQLVGGAGVWALWICEVPSVWEVGTIGAYEIADLF